MSNLVSLLESDKVKDYEIEKELDSYLDAIKIRREYYISIPDSIPYSEFDYEQFYKSIYKKNCENVIGYIPIPLGLIKYVKIDNFIYNVPFATTEGALVASLNKAAKATLENGIKTICTNNNMTRAPVLECLNQENCFNIKKFIENKDNFDLFQNLFKETTYFGKLKNIDSTIVGKYIYIRFDCFTGDAMGMNMVGKGVDNIVQHLLERFSDLRLISLSSNLCCDKKANAMNWIKGRGKSCNAETVIKKEILEKHFNVSVDDVVKVNINKNLIGSSMAGSIGGNNSHACNIITGLFLATGQDPAQNIVSSNCLTVLEKTKNNDLYISVNMPSIEVGTIGGGTNITPQKSCLEMLHVGGASKSPLSVGDNAVKLGQICCAVVLLGELSLTCSLASNTLINSHLKLNR